jgi:hypothetical protein
LGFERRYFFRTASGLVSVLADYGVEATLPAATMQFYDPADDAMITLSSDPLTFQAKIPLRASADVDLQVAPDSQQTVVATVTNVDSSSARQGDLVLHVWTITGTEVLSTIAHVSLGAGGSQDYDLAYTAPDEGLYVLEVALHYGDETTPAIYDLLKVRENQVYPPVVLRNWDAGARGVSQAARLGRHRWGDAAGHARGSARYPAGCGRDRARWAAVDCGRI